MKSKLESKNRVEIAQAIAEKKGVTFKVAYAVIDGFLEEVKEQFQSGNKVQLRGFGTFYPYYKKARSYVITRLKEEQRAQGRVTLKFKPSKEIILYED